MCITQSGDRPMISSVSSGRIVGSFAQGYTKSRAVDGNSSGIGAAGIVFWKDINLSNRGRP
jgi:hypothetical protein